MMSVAPKELKLCSPVGAEAITYRWPLCRGKSYNGVTEIVETIKLVSNDCPELRFVTEKVLRDIDFDSYESLKSLCDKFNKAAQVYKNLNKGTSKFPATDFASVPLLRHIVQQVYNRSVTEPERLNSYEPFTPAVYGETSFDLITKMIEIVKPTEDEVFMDLGSGVGQVVVQMAGGSKCKKCIGIEKAEVPASYARTVDFEFRKWMKWYGKPCRDFELIEGDFLDTKYREMIMNCTLILVNNFAFGPEVDHKLKSIFADMPDGTKIVSSKAFCPLNFRITDRNLSDVGTIMNVSELWAGNGNVSWTDRPVTYYLHVIDRKKLEDYFSTIHNNGGGGSKPELRRSGSKASCQSWSSRESASSNIEFLSAEHVRTAEEQENFVLGTTTRRQYASWLAKQRKPQPSLAPSRSSAVKPKRPKGQMIPLAATSMQVEATIGASDDSDSAQEDEEEEEDDEDEEEEEEVEEDTSKAHKPSTALRRTGRPRKSQATLKAQQAKKKYQKQRRPGRPPVKRFQKKKAQEWMGVLDILHQQIVSGPVASGDSVNQAMPMPERRVLHEDQSVAVNSVSVNCSAALEQHLARLGKQYQDFLAYMATPHYRVQLMENIERERAKQQTLRERGLLLERQIMRLQEEGVQLLRSRMFEVGIQAETPAELLNKAKEIVMDHQALQNRANILDSELRDLQKQNEYLVALCRERDEQMVRSGTLQSMGYTGSLTTDEAKSAILSEIGLLFNRRRALLVEVSRFQNEIQSLEANVPPTGNVDVLLSHFPSATSAPVSVASSTPAPASSSVTPPAEIRPTATTTPVRKRGAASTPRRKSVSGRASRAKQKTPASDTTVQPAVTAGVSAPTASAEGSQDDIEEKIRDIVRKALSVDNAAKKAEKERKARTAERKRGGKSTVESSGEKTMFKSKQTMSSAAVKGKPDGASAGGTCIDETISEAISTIVSSCAVQQETDSERPLSRASSATESAPSDHEDFRPSADNANNTSVVSPEKTCSTQRPSSVPVWKGGQFTFTVSSLIGAASIADESASQSAGYPRVTSAFARIDCVSTSTTARTGLDEASSQTSTSTITDSGFSETRPVGEPSATSIPYPSLFGGSSANVGQPGNPHAFSNPGNPVTDEKAYQNPFKGTSNTGNAGNPHDYSNPGNPSTPEENDVMEPKLLQPFRIPRRTVKASDSPDTRSPLAYVAYVKREDTGSSRTPISSMKRRKEAEMTAVKKRLISADTTILPFEKMVAPKQSTATAAATTTNRKTRSHSVHSGSSSGSSRKRTESSSGAGQTVLTKEVLERHAACQEVHSFSEKGLMEVLLEHKMMAGRIESHTQIAGKLRFVPGPVGPSTPPAPATGNRRGPKTPENTPPSSHTPSHRSHYPSSRRSDYSGVSALGPDSLSGQPPGSVAPRLGAVTEQRTSGSPTSNRNASTLETLARLTNIDTGQLAKCLNEDALRTLQDVDPALLVATLSTLLTTVVKSVEGPIETTAPADKSEELVTSTSMVEDRGQQQRAQQSQAIEMEIASSSRSGTPAPMENEPSQTAAPPEEKTNIQPVRPASPQFQPHQLFQPLFSMPPPPSSMGPSVPAPPAPSFPPTPAQQQDTLRCLFMLMQPFKEQLGEGGHDGGMRDGPRLARDYYYGDPCRRCPSPEPAFTMPPPPRPVRIDYSYPTPRELTVLGSQISCARPAPPPPPGPFQSTMQRPPFPSGPLGPPIPSLLQCPTAPPIAMRPGRHARGTGRMARP